MNNDLFTTEVEQKSTNELLFHTSRSEREKLIPSTLSKPFDKKAAKRGRLILLFDILILVILAFVIIPVLREKQRSVSAEGVDFTLKGYRIPIDSTGGDDEIVVLLTVKRKRGVGNGEFFEADISIGTEKKSVKDIPPRKMGNEITKKLTYHSVASLPKEKKNLVEATVSYHGHTKQLRSTIEDLGD